MEKSASSTFSADSITDAKKAQRLLKTISEIIQALNQKGQKLDKKINIILDILLGYLGVEQGSIMVKERRCLEVVAATRRELIGMRQSLDQESISVWVTKSLQPIFIPDISKDSRFVSRSGEMYKRNALLSVPIIQGDKLLGVINVTDKEGAKDFLKEDISYLLDFSSMIISILMQQKMQKELRRQKSTLKKRNFELQRQEKLRDELYRLLIHDLKAPLAEVVANLDIMSYSINDDNKIFLDSAQVGCDRAVRMISNLITINHIEDGKLKPYREDVEPRVLIEESYSAIKGIAQIKNITLKMAIEEDLPIAFLDRILILRVLQNLLTNALGYSPSGTTITIGCKKVSGTDKIEFFIKDEGPGISEEKQKEIFEKYSRVSKKQDALVGTGLGLHFCKLAIDIHRGKIGIESSLNTGSRFYFILSI